MFDFKGSLVILPNVLHDDINRPVIRLHGNGTYKVYRMDLVPASGTAYKYCDGCGRHNFEIRMYVGVLLNRGDGDHVDDHEPEINNCSSCLHDLWGTMNHIDKPWSVIEGGHPLDGAPIPSFIAGTRSGVPNTIPGREMCIHGFSVDSRCPIKENS